MESDTEPRSTIPLFLSFFRKSNRRFRGRDRELLDYVNSDLEESKKQMIHGIMKLSELCAREIMIPRVDIVSIKHNTSLKEIITIASDAGHSRIPVYNSTIDEITGILYVKNLLTYILDKRRKFDIKKELHKPFFIPETMPLDELLVDFKKKRQHLAVVVDEYGGVAGLVTMEDILEEIVGDINDEFDEHEAPECIKLSKGVFDVDSRMSITDLNSELGTSLPTEEFDTIGGLVFDLFGKIPEKNDTIEFDSMKFEVKEIEGTRINRITIRKTRIRKND
ncbi:MAG: hemolysin family protein [Spirochaetes bacterium]|jgi:magnesium and cobalt transporter|nr:hemolysin family protein [Spirochaetota bacterium]